MNRPLPSPVRFGRALACGALVLGACSSPVETGLGSTTTTSTSSTRTSSTRTSTTMEAVTSSIPDMEMFFDYPRYLWHLRRLSVATTNVGDEPVVISSIAVRADHFEPLEPESKRTIIAPGQRVDVQVDFGDLTGCVGDGAPTAAVAIEVAAGEEGPRTYLVSLDPAPLDEMRDRECAQRRVSDAASIHFSADRSIDGSTMATSIEIVREEGSPVVELTSLSGSVIFALVPAEVRQPLAVLEPELDRLEVPITIEVTRCDPHVVSQSSRTFDLATFVRVDGAEAHRHRLDVDRRLQSELQSMIEHCAAGLG